MTVIKSENSCNIGYMKINERIKLLRKSAKLSQEKVAELCGVTRVTITHYESGKNSPSGKNLLNLAKALNTTPAYIINGISEVKSSEVSEVGCLEQWDGSTPLHDDEVEVPFFKEVELAAGSGSLVTKENSTFKLRFSRTTLRRYNVDPSAAACVTVSGDSMSPILPDKSTVGINTASKTIKDGFMYALDHDGFLRIKVVHRLPGGGLRLRSFNRDDFPDEDYNQEEAKKIKVLGSVFWYSVLLPQ
ncbi:XRE family transcriptional regulator [Parasphingorhabdus sp.]|uniref:XRE family transcriptional regulator n=1 Tax=Parasphingorhabdus sp. TaxID=2709688 RepID=UPI003A935E40